MPVMPSRTTTGWESDVARRYNLNPIMAEAEAREAHRRAEEAGEVWYVCPRERTVALRAMANRAMAERMAARRGWVAVDQATYESWGF